MKFVAASSLQFHVVDRVAPHCRRNATDTPRLDVCPQSVGEPVLTITPPEDVPISGARAPTCFREAGYELLGVSPEHAVEPLRLITHYRAPAAYGDTVIRF